MTNNQMTAFVANGGFTPASLEVLLLSSVFVVLLLWGVWAMRAAYVGWAEDGLSSGKFVIVIVRFIAMYVVLTYLLLS
jgi:integrating conjugative element protein (TIGR03758 family)